MTEQCGSPTSHLGENGILCLCHLLFDHVQFTLIHASNMAGSCAGLFFTVSDFTFTPRHIHNWASLLLWLSLFILSGHLLTWGDHLSVPYFLYFHTVHGVLKAKILTCFAIPFSSGPCFVTPCLSGTCPSCLSAAACGQRSFLVPWLSHLGV